MGFQSSLLAAGAALGGAISQVGKNINEFVKRQEQAQEKTKQVQEAKTKQRRNFMEYLGKQQLRGGGTVGDLPQDIQKKIAQNYSKADRQKLMNQMDREAGKKR